MSSHFGLSEVRKGVFVNLRGVHANDLKQEERRDAYQVPSKLRLMDFTPGRGVRRKLSSSRARTVIMSLKLAYVRFLMSELRLKDGRHLSNHDIAPDGPGQEIRWKK